MFNRTDHSYFLRSGDLDMCESICSNADRNRDLSFRGSAKREWVLGLNTHSLQRANRWVCTRNDHSGDLL